MSPGLTGRRCDYRKVTRLLSGVGYWDTHTLGNVGMRGLSRGPWGGFQICDADQGACGCFQHFQSLCWALRAWNWSSVNQRIYIKTLNWSFKIMSSMSVTDSCQLTSLTAVCVCVCELAVLVCLHNCMVRTRPPADKRVPIRWMIQSEGVSSV